MLQAYAAAHRAIKEHQAAVPTWKAEEPPKRPTKEAPPIPADAFAAAIEGIEAANIAAEVIRQGRQELAFERYGLMAALRKAGYLPRAIAEASGWELDTVRRSLGRFDKDPNEPIRRHAFNAAYQAIVGDAQPEPEPQEPVEVVRMTPWRSWRHPRPSKPVEPLFKPAYRPMNRWPLATPIYQENA